MICFMLNVLNTELCPISLIVESRVHTGQTKVKALSTFNSVETFCGSSVCDGILSLNYQTYSYTRLSVFESFLLHH